MSEQRRAPVVVIDDDPTGSQTVHDIDLVFGVAEAAIRERLRRGDAAFFVLTNSRSGDAAAAARTSARITGIVVSEPGGDEALIVSRGDSTLRGHVRAEVEAIRGELGATAVTRVFAPAFIEAGRFTRDGVHYVRTDAGDVPVGETAFARDAAFGFRSSHLRDFLVEVGAASGPAEVTAIGADELRSGGPRGVADAIARRGEGWLIADAIEDDDLRVLAEGIRLARERGAAVIVRSGPSVPRHLASQPRRGALGDAELAARFGRREGHGLVAVGSHVPLTSAQVAGASGLPGLATIELDAAACAAGGATADAEVARVVAEASRALAGDDVMIATSREELRDGDSLAVAGRIADALSAAVRGVVSEHPPAWVIGKGGITSHRVASDALGITSGTVVGQLFDGQVSVLDPHDGLPGVAGAPYVIFPGNVGDAGSLRAAVERMRGLG